MIGFGYAGHRHWDRIAAKRAIILMVEVLFPRVAGRAGKKTKSEMNRCLPIWLSRPTSHQPTLRLRSDRSPTFVRSTRKGDFLFR